MPKNAGHGQAAIISSADYAKILDKLENPKHRLFFQIAFWTGERWGCIRQIFVGGAYRDPQKRIPHDVITFRAATRKRDPKGRALTRQVPVHPTLADALRAYSPLSDPRAYLFPGNPADRPISFQAADKFFRLALVAAQLDGRGISTHSTRRSLITNLDRQGVSLRVIQEITGHADLKNLQKYIEVSEEQAVAAIARL